MMGCKTFRKVLTTVHTVIPMVRKTIVTKVQRKENQLENCLKRV